MHSESTVCTVNSSCESKYIGLITPIHVKTHVICKERQQHTTSLICILCKVTAVYDIASHCKNPSNITRNPISFL